MTKRIERILAFLDELFPHAGCELIYHHDYELVIAVMLSAQTTDRSVNKVTEVLFSRYPTLEALAHAPLEDIENCIRTIGMYRQKAKHVHLIAQDILERYQGKVPQDKDALMSLSGVGNKTANVVRAELFSIPEIAVDTHVNRVSKRLGIAKETDTVLEVEKKLQKALPKERYILTHHQMIHFGRYFCKAMHPHCQECQLVDLCSYSNKKI